MSGDLLCGVVLFIVLAFVLGWFFWRALWGAGNEWPRDRR